LDDRDAGGWSDIGGNVDADESVRSWQTAAATARIVVAEKHGLRPEVVDLQAAAVHALGLSEPLDLLGREWTGDELVSLVKGIDFAAWADFEEIEVDRTLLVTATRRLDEETVKFESERWRIHRYDPDPFPFLPHAHNLSVAVKMDLRDGAQYRKRVYLGSLPRKRLIAFRDRVKRIVLPDLTV